MKTSNLKKRITGVVALTLALMFIISTIAMAAPAPSQYNPSDLGDATALTRTPREPRGERFSDADFGDDPAEIVEIAVQFVTPPAVALRLLDEDRGVLAAMVQTYERRALAAHTAFRSQIEGLTPAAPPGVMTPQTVPFEIFSEHHNLFNGVFMRVPRYMVRQIEELPEVSAVTPNQRFYTTAAPTTVPTPRNPGFIRESRDLFNITYIHNTMNITGAGVRVAVLDTGIDHNHPELTRFRDPATGRIRGRDFTGSPHGLMDIDGHGTHVSGTVIAMAPNVELWHYKVLGDDGYGDWSWTISGLEQAYIDGMDVVNLSLGADFPGLFTFVDQAVNLLVLDGVIAVVAAGNLRESGLYTVTTPSLAGLAITVASGTKGGLEQDNLGDTISDFSSRGPMIGTWHIKPDITAPGTAIYSALPTRQYAARSGTSMAAPHIAGVAALLLQQSPTATPIEVKARMMNTARTLEDYPNDVFSIGAGFVVPINALRSQTFATVRHEIPWGEPDNNRMETMASLSFGAVDRDVADQRNVTIPVTIHNRSNVSQTYTITREFTSTATNQPRPNLATSTSITVGANSTETFDATMQVAANTATGLHYGFLNINLERSPVARLPFAVRVSGAVTVSNEQQLIDAIFDYEGRNIVINVDRNIDLTETLIIPEMADVTLRGIGTTMPALTATGSQDAVLIDWNAILTIDNIEITRTAASRGRGIVNAGTLIMQSGFIRGHNNSGDYGGGVRNWGIFNMLGGEISGNAADSGAGVDNLNLFIMEGGSISNNNAPTGSGIYNGEYGLVGIFGGVVYGVGDYVADVVADSFEGLHVHDGGAIIVWNGTGTEFNHGTKTGLVSQPADCAYWDVRGGVANNRNDIFIPVTGVTVNPQIRTVWFPPLPQEQLFPDSRNHWAGRNGYIGWAMANNITTGFPDGTFRPNAPVTRAQFVTFLHRIAGEPAASSVAAFPDMPANPAFQAAISWAVEAGVTTGFDDGTFRPDADIERQQIATMLQRYIDGDAPAGALGRFTDHGQVSGWALAGMRWVAHNYVMGVNLTEIRPRDTATRGEAVAMLSRVVDLFNLPVQG